MTQNVEIVQMLVVGAEVRTIPEEMVRYVS